MNAPASRDGPIVIALGGNALLDADEAWTADAQLAVVERTAERIAEVVDAGDNVVITHGNGPQVGNLLLQQEAATETPQLPLDVVVAETQGQIGYLLQQALDNEVSDARDSATLVTRVVVDADDPSFEEPRKPVGPFYTPAEAAEKPFETRAVSDGPRSHRRVVPSPIPTDVVEVDTIDDLLAQGRIVVCGGGGGVPVVRDDTGALRGIEAVVDKDRTSQVLGSALDAALLVVLTNVEYAFENFETSDQRPIRQATPAELSQHLEAGEFAPGSMRPKVEACCRFIQAGGQRAVITTPANLLAAIDGSAGTQIRSNE